MLVLDRLPEPLHEDGRGPVRYNTQDAHALLNKLGNAP